MKKMYFLIFFTSFMLTFAAYAQQGAMDEFKTLFPSPLSGWEIGEIEVEKIEQDAFEKGLTDLQEDLDFFGSVLGGAPSTDEESGKKGEPEYFQGTRVYTKKNGDGQITLGINTSFCDYVGVIPSAGAHWDDDLVKNMEKEGLKPFEYEDFKGVELYDSDRRFSGIVLGIGTCRVFAILVDEQADKNTALKYLERSDLKKIKTFMGRYKGIAE